MSSLDSFIARMQAQRDCLNFLKPAVDRLGSRVHSEKSKHWRERWDRVG
jgi:hypothetical protein